MPEIFNPKNRHLLFSVERRKRLPVRPVINALNLRPGCTLIDIGAGTGYFALPALRLIGKTGTLIAIDRAPEMLDELKNNLPATSSNVLLLNARAEKIPLPDRLAHRVLIALALHEFSSRTQALREAHRLLRPRGRMVVVEWEKLHPPPGPPRKERISPSELRKLAAGIGFTHTGCSSLGRFHYLAIFRP